MALKSIVCKDSTQIRVVAEKDSIKIPSFPFIPVGGIEQLTSTRHMIRFSCIRFDPNPALMLKAQKVVHNFKPLLSLWEIYSTNVHDRLELTLRVISQEREHGNKA
jgi:hypothetical protein